MEWGEISQLPLIMSIDPAEHIVQYTFPQDDVPGVVTVPKSGAIRFDGDHYVAAGEYVAREMATTPGFCAVSFSSSGENIINVIENALRTKFGYTQFKTRNAECIQITVDGDVRTFHSYPSAPQMLRGTYGNVAILEEASYVPPEVGDHNADVQG